MATTCIGLARIRKSVQASTPGTSRVMHRTLAEPRKKALFQVSFTKCESGILQALLCKDAIGNEPCNKLPNHPPAIKRQVKIIIYEINLMPFLFVTMV